jgi:benzoyl-CoA reductase/2-hydroxyglutaryl-CoA dehydratase subunit BcrC/BadD/HgdB
MNEEQKVVRKVLKSAKDGAKFMADYYYELDHAAKTGDRKIAWCTSVGPAEILRAMGFLVYFPETHAAMLGATRMATDLIPYANAAGYSPEICSYLTADIGAHLQGVSPLSRAYKGIEGPPKPDVLVFNTNQCRDVQDWFAFYAEKYTVPMLGVYTYVGVKDVIDTLVPSIAKQFEDLIAPLEKVIGKPFSMSALKRTMTLSRECSELWKKILDTASAKPSPLTFSTAQP